MNFLTFMTSVFLMNKLQLSFIKIIKNIKYILISNCILVVYYAIFLWAISINSNLQTWYFKFAILFSGGFLYLFLQFMFPSNAFNLIKNFTRINETFTYIKNFLKISNKVR